MTEILGILLLPVTKKSLEEFLPPVIAEKKLILSIKIQRISFNSLSCMQDNKYYRKIIRSQEGLL